MKSRKMVLINLFVGMEWRHRYGKWTYGHSGGKKEWDSQVVWDGHVHTAVFKMDNQGLPWWFSVKHLSANAGDMGSIPDLGRCHMSWSS